MLHEISLLWLYRLRGPRIVAQSSAGDWLQTKAQDYQKADKK
jgi:hypothetical protein